MGVKFLSFGKPIKVVSIYDEAIDKTAMGAEGMKAYQEAYDVSLLKFVEGETPDYFMLGNVAGPDLVVIQQDHYKTVLPDMEPGMSVDDMKKLKVKVVPVEQGMMLVKYFKAGIKSMIIQGDKEVDLDELMMNSIPPTIIQELGSFVMTRATLGETKKKS